MKNLTIVQCTKCGCGHKDECKGHCGCHEKECKSCGKAK